MATEGHEVEIKFRVKNLKALSAELRAAGFRLKTKRTHEMNTLYDFPNGDLRQRGEVLRLRKYGRVWTLTHKGAGEPGRHKSRKETETEVTHGEKLNDVLLSIGLHPRFRYEKFRTEWTKGKGDVVVDETPVGNYGEIEGPADWIDAIAKRLGITEENYITKSYSELFLEWKGETGRMATEMTWAAVRAKDHSS
jgi:adenylate cyclase class 2